MMQHLRKTEITAISKIDAMDPETVAEVSAGLQDAGAEMIMPLSAIQVRDAGAMRQLWQVIDAARIAEAAADEEQEPWTP